MKSCALTAAGLRSEEVILSGRLVYDRVVVLRIEIAREFGLPVNIYCE